MTEQARIWLLIAVAFASALVSWAVTYIYWRERFYSLLRDHARERAGEQQELRNARIINRTFGEMRATSIANMGEDHGD